MIKKFSPAKLKSPLEHLQQVSVFIIDLIGILMAIVNIILIINCLNILNYTYVSNSKYNYLKYSAKLVHKSVLDLIKLFYVKVFFRIFPWRYLNSIN